MFTPDSVILANQLSRMLGELALRKTTKILNLQLQRMKTPKQTPNPHSFCYYCKDTGHGKRDFYKFKTLRYLHPLTSLSNVLPTVNGGATRNYRGSANSSLLNLIGLEKYVSTLGMNLF